MSFEKLEQELNLINRLLIASGVHPASADFNVIKIHSLLEMFYEHTFIEDMTKQCESSVDRAVNAMAKPWVGLTDEEIRLMAHNDDDNDWDDLHHKYVWHKGYLEGARAIEAALRSKNERHKV